MLQGFPILGALGNFDPLLFILLDSTFTTVHHSNRERGTHSIQPHPVQRLEFPLVICGMGRNKSAKCVGPEVNVRKAVLC